METEYLKDHFDMRVYGIVGHLHAKLDSVKHASDTRTVNIKIKEGEDTYLALRLVFGVQPGCYLKEVTAFGDLCKGLLESGWSKFTASMYTHMSPLFLFADKIGAKIDFNPIFNKLTEGCSDDQFTLFSDKEGSLFNGRFGLVRSFLLREIDGGEGIAYIVKTINDTDFSGNGDIDLVFDASIAITDCRVYKGEKETKPMLFTKAAMHEWSITTYNWLIGDMTNTLYNAWKTIEFGGDVEDMCYQPTIIINTEYGEKQGA